MEGMGIEFRSNRRKRSRAAFVGGIVRPAKGSGNLVGVAITSAHALAEDAQLQYRRFAKTCVDFAQSPGGIQSREGIKGSGTRHGDPGSYRDLPQDLQRGSVKELVEGLRFMVMETAHTLSSSPVDPPCRAQSR